MPLNTTNKKIIYKSEDITIAAVDENGVVTPTDKIGDTFIDIRCGNALSKLKVSVVKGVEGVAMSQSEMTLYADKTYGYGFADRRDYSKSQMVQ